MPQAHRWHLIRRPTGSGRSIPASFPPLVIATTMLAPTWANVVALGRRRRMGLSAAAFSAAPLTLGSGDRHSPASAEMRDCSGGRRIGTSAQTALPVAVG
jgi:hypothetical protein